MDYFIAVSYTHLDVYKRQDRDSERERVIDCKDVVINVEELDNEWKDSIVVEWGQRVNVPLIYDDLMLSLIHI